MQEAQTYISEEDRMQHLAKLEAQREGLPVTEEMILTETTPDAQERMRREGLEKAKLYAQAKRAYAETPGVTRRVEPGQIIGEAPIQSAGEPPLHVQEYPAVPRRKVQTPERGENQLAA